MKSHLLRAQSLEVLTSKPGVCQYIATHATLTARDFFLANFYPSGPFTCIFSKPLLSVSCQVISLQLVSIMSKGSKSVWRYHQLLSTYMHSKVNALHLPARLGNVKRFLLTICLKELMLQSCLDAPLR